MKRSITFNFQFSIFSLLMFLFVFTAQGAWAQSGNWKDYAASGYASGSGTIDDPYIIKTADQLAYMAKQINAGVKLDSYYVLGADINLGAHYWNPIGSLSYDVNKTFKGSFDGKGHIISNMKIDWYDNSGSKLGFGFFSTIGAGTSARWSEVKNVIFENALLKNDNTSGLGNSRYLGILTATVMNYSKVQNIIIRSSQINGPSSSFNQNGKYFIVGGCAGKIENNNNNYNLSNIAVDVAINLENLNANNQGNVWIGGFIGECKDEVKNGVNNVYSLGSITMPSSCQKVGSVFAVQYSKLVTTTLYYVNAAKVNTGTKKSLSSFATSFCNANNEYIKSNTLLLVAVVAVQLIFHPFGGGKNKAEEDIEKIIKTSFEKQCDNEYKWESAENDPHWNYVFYSKLSNLRPERNQEYYALPAEP